MNNPIVNFIVVKLLPILAAFLATFVMTGLKKAWDMIDAMPALIQRAIVVALGVALAFVFTWAGVQLPVECVEIANGITDNCWAALTGDQKVVAGVIGSVLAMLWHAARNRGK